MNDLELLELAAAKQDFPAWATHVAVQAFDKRVEPAAWHPEAKRVIAEDPATMPRGAWATVFKRDYWRIFSLEEVRASGETARR